MRQQMFPFLAILAMIPFTNIAMAAPPNESGSGQGFPPYMGGGISGHSGNNIDWSIGMAGQFTTYDSVWFTCNLTNTADRRAVFHMKGLPTLEVTSAGHPPIRVPLAEGPGLPEVSYTQTPSPLEKLFHFRADLRFFTGRLEPGRYRLQLTWPAAQYSVEGLPDYKPRDLVSPEWTFQVLAASPDAALRNLRPWQHLIRRNGPPEPLTAGPLPTGRFTNSLSEPCGIPYYPEFGSDNKPVTRPPLQVPLYLMKWVGTGSLAVFSPREQDLPLWGLKPGESVEIILPDSRVDGDGIYLYDIHVHRDVPNGKPQFLQEAFSEPFVIDSLTARKTP